MKSKNSTNLHQVDGGKIIKQNDTQSTFSYELQDENYNRLDSLNGQNATVIFVNEDTRNIVYQKNVIVENGTVTFNVSETIEPSTYIVEVKCGGYIFASDNRMKIKVVETAFSKHEVLETNKDVVTIDISELKKLKETFDNINIDDYTDRLPEKAIENFNFYKHKITTDYRDLQITVNAILENIKDDVNATMTSLELDYTEYKKVLSSFNLDELSDIKKSHVSWLGDPILASQATLDEYVLSLKEILERNE